MQSFLSYSRSNKENFMTLDPLFTIIPGQDPIELVAYYPQFATYYPQCELATKQWFVKNAEKDWVYLDCGANIGYYSILFSRLSPEGYVYAFEPTTTIDMLKANISHHNKNNNIFPLQVALGKTSGQINDRIFRIWAKDPEEKVYPFITIDEFVLSMDLKKIDCIKIDVDSFDFEVLQGAKQTLLDRNPYVMVELNHALSKRNQSMAEALEWLAGLGYETVTFFEYENCLLKKNDPKKYSISRKIEICFHDGAQSNECDTPLANNAEIATGEAFFNQRKFGKALMFFRELADRFPCDYRIYNNIGTIHYHMGNVERGLVFFQKGRAICPTDPDLIFNLATTHAALGHFSQALAVCRQASGADAQKQIASLVTELERRITKSEVGSEKFLVPEIPIPLLHQKLGFSKPLDCPRANIETPLDKWKMEVHDAPILRYIYRNFRPKRHLEFGTWQGAGTVYCLEECEATVWTINLPFGENNPDGGVQYSGDGDSFGLGTAMAATWATRIGLPEADSYRTDCFGFIGRFYLERGLGHRVCQIYCDSTQWDDAAYPDGFFDSVLVDGGHTPEIVASDTRKALRLLRPGGVILWHDFCPPVADKFPVTRGVRDGLSSILPLLHEQCARVFWINPSWILMGMKNAPPSRADKTWPPGA
jgi:FkbM family methyltransferase